MRSVAYYSEQINELSKSIAMLTAQVKALQPPSKFTYRLIHDSKHIRLIDDEIVFIQVEGNYSIFHCDKNKNLPEKILHGKPLHDVIDALNPEVFIQCHRSYVINASYVRGYMKNKKGTGGMLYLKDNTEIPFKNTYANMLLEKGVID